ncbi:MAG: ABC-F family ATP-binding cassette domain-containing protein [Bacteroidia bacterium]|nr:ABC-F family ATP-binding cassette domain-containing protein [Bacteroidia bacterium]
MNLLSAENIAYTAGDKKLFTSLNFGLSRGDRVGLIGVNGTGKSTFLKVLAGKIPPDSGKVSVRKDCTVGYLGQNPELDPALSVFDNVFNNSNPLTDLIRQYEAHVAHPGDSVDYLNELDRLNNEMMVQDAWSYEARIKEIISRLGIAPFMEQSVGSLSGGQKKRVALAKILAEEPEILILDEPTNHLDIETVEWLQNLITSRFDTILIVTHDRYFLDAVSNQIAELERGDLYKYQGNYAYFLEKKQERKENAKVEMERARNLYRKELEWMRRMPKARGTKSKSRISAFDDLKEKISGPPIDDKITLEIKDRRQGGKILEARGIGKSIDTKLLIGHFRHHFQKGEKVGIVGQNGCGKTTLLRLLTGQIKPDKGDIVTGENTVIGYYSQEEDLPQTEMGKRLIDVVTEIAPNIELADKSIVSASQFLNRFLFPPQDQYKTVDKLSGGERKRLQLLRILIQNPNFLILDEPTNDLDIETLNVLEEFLETFGGSVIIVSHDRYFLDRLAQHLFVFEGGGEIRDFPGNYTDYREWLDERKQVVKKEAAKIEKTATKVAVETKSKRSYKEQRELELTEKAMEDGEARKIAIHDLLSTTTDHQTITDLALELEELDKNLEALMLKWIELSEK